MIQLEFINIVKISFEYASVTSEPPCQQVQQSLSFTCLILMYWTKPPHESSKIFVVHVLHVARVQFRIQT